MEGHLYIFRMTHISNLDFIIKNGIWSMNSNVQDPDFVPIGNSDIIYKRRTSLIKINPPGGALGDYIPFYFAGHSPMLYNIITGYNVKQFPQKDIVFIVCDAKRIAKSETAWCFTDGNAKSKISAFYSSLSDVDKLDWDVIRSRWWRADENDMDRPRKKMAEFLVRDHIPIELIDGFIVRDDSAYKIVKQLIADNNSSMKVEIDKNNNLYYDR